MSVEDDNVIHEMSEDQEE